MAPPAAVAELVDRFQCHRDAYRSGQYHEAQLREEFLGPFFEALGWDVYNRQGWWNHEKTVIQRQIDATDRQIDRLVYELCELSDNEIAIVEQATASHRYIEETKNEHSTPGP